VADESITALLKSASAGDVRAQDRLFPLVYDELRRLARSALLGDRTGHTLQPTALLHETYLRLFGKEPPEFNDRAHFLGVAARAMRQVLVDYARTRNAQKRGGGLQVTLTEKIASQPAPANVLELDEALETLGKEDPRLVSLIEMRFFAGMSAEETASARDESVHVIRHDLRYAQARLRRILEGSSAR